MSTKFFYESIFDDTESLPLILTAPPKEENLDLLTPSPNKKLYFYGIPVLTNSQEKHLFRKMNCLKYLSSIAKNEDEKLDKFYHAIAVRNKIVYHNIRLVLKILKPYVMKGKQDPDELFSEANQTILIIVESFDYRMNFCFSTFCTTSIRNNINHYLWQKNKKKKVLTGMNGIFQFLEDYRTKNYEEIEEDYEKLKKIIEEKVIDERTKEIILLRLGLKDGIFWDFKEIARIFKITPTRVCFLFNREMNNVFGTTIRRPKSFNGGKNERGKIPFVHIRNFNERRYKE